MHSLLIPDDSLHAEDFFSNGTNAPVGVAVRRTPVLGETTASRVVNDLHGEAELAEQSVVIQSRHVTMSPGVYGDVAPDIVVRPLEHIGVVQNIDTDEEVCSLDVVLLQERIQRLALLQLFVSKVPQSARRVARTGRGPSSKLVENTPSGASQR